MFLNNNLINLEKLFSEIRAFELLAGRPKDSVNLIAVSKTQPVEKIKFLYQQGIRNFGENYLQEALPKIQELRKSEEYKNIIWHFIGPIQSNKTALIAENFDWVHSVDRVKIAQRLSDQRSQNFSKLSKLSICLQVNIDHEASKSGVDPSEVLDLALACQNLEDLNLRGLMCIPEKKLDLNTQREAFRKLKNLLENLNNSGLKQPLDILSMGMSDDFKAAILEGANFIRIGTRVFGARN